MTREERRLVEKLLRLIQRLTKEGRIPWRGSLGWGLNQPMYEFSCATLFIAVGRVFNCRPILTLRIDGVEEKLMIRGALVEQLLGAVHDFRRGRFLQSGKSGKPKNSGDEKEKARREILRGALRLLGDLAK